MRYIISGGGTGGHIFPAIAIANELKEQDKNAEILFVGALGKMEMEKVPAAGFPIEGLPISGIQRKLTLGNLSFPFKLYSSLQKAGQVLRKFRPDIAIGVGGYASGPLLWTASRMHIPCVIQEQNSFAGLTNRWLGKRVQKICVAYEGMEKFFPKEKIILTGNPVRKEIIAHPVPREEALSFFGLQSGKKTILVVGGSQGARSINESISEGLKKMIDQDIQLIWQTGKNSFFHHPDTEKLESHSLVHKTAFIQHMELAYSAADLVISRAGAIAVSELCIRGLAAIFVPLPGAAENHQWHNAQRLVNKKAALILIDSEARKNLATLALQTIQQPKELDAMSKNIQLLAQPEATQKIVEVILSLH